MYWCTCVACKLGWNDEWRVGKLQFYFQNIKSLSILATTATTYKSNWIDRRKLERKCIVTIKSHCITVHMLLTGGMLCQWISKMKWRDAKYRVLSEREKTVMQIHSQHPLVLVRIFYVKWTWWCAAVDFILLMSFLSLFLAFKPHQNGGNFV